MYGNGSKLQQSFGEAIRVLANSPVANGEPQWNSASTWSQPISISTIPGSGSIQTMSVFMYGNGSKLQQSFWRGDQGFWRIVPVANGEPQWSCGVVPTATPVVVAPAQKSSRRC